MTSSNGAAPTIMWFRNDLRLQDNLALTSAAQNGPIIACFIWDETIGAGRKIGQARCWWLHHSLESLKISLQARGGTLHILKGKAEDTLVTFAKETGAKAIYWNSLPHPETIKQDETLADLLHANDIAAVASSGHILHDPTAIKTGAGGFYRVYTPFWKSTNHIGMDDQPLPIPALTFAYAESDITIDDLGLMPHSPNWAEAFPRHWQPGEDGAAKRLDSFMDDAAKRYDTGRDVPSINGTSGLSPHLAHGEISPLQILATLRTNRRSLPDADYTTFHKEIVWREFAYHLLNHSRDLTHHNHNQQFDQFIWSQDKTMIKAWQRGMTGYPIVDAGMRQLWQTGWMHNRVRMIVASFLCKHLLVDWRIGEEWFWDTLVDADPASNPASWQWVAGTGADAAPYFRIFNPILQGEKFDKEGTYVKKYVPELKLLPIKYVNKPWEAPKALLEKAGIELGTTYPNPIVDHKFARDRALATYQEMREMA